MSEIAVAVKNLSKIYRIYDHPSDRIKEAFSFRRLKYSKDFLALRDINFEIKKGEFFGIVGRNGAGKSTLLKLLSNEIAPTTGEIQINGRISLLQIGVGFDPDLSGYENAVFAAKVMGYGDSEIPNVLRAVEEFAEIGEFFHHPVKTYSTGMHSRLSFAIAINVDPEILIVDEVLAVGDIRFSQKCLRKMHEFKAQGKTVILVTHDTSSIGVFCDRAMWIKDGVIYEMGEAKLVSEDYRTFMLLNKLPDHIEKKNEPGFQSDRNLEPVNVSDDGEWLDVRKYPQVCDGVCQVTHFLVCQKSPFVKKATFEGDEEIVILLKAVTHKPLKDAHFGIVLNDKNGLMAIHTNNQICDSSIESIDEGKSLVARFEIKLPNLNNGDYAFSVSMGGGDDTNCRIHGIFPIRIQRDVPDRMRQYGYVRLTEQSFTLEDSNS